jgi:hypothetical protein
VATRDGVVQVDVVALPADEGVTVLGEQLRGDAPKNLIAPLFYAGPSADNGSGGSTQRYARGVGDENAERKEMCMSHVEEEEKEPGFIDGRLGDGRTHLDAIEQRNGN